MRRRTEQTPNNSTIFVCAIAWAVPGAGHLWLGRTQKGLVFLTVLPAMCFVGLWLEGQIFSFDLSQPMVALAAVADIGIGVTYLVVQALGFGEGRVVAPTYEYGNTFLVVAGLLNALVVLDAYDISLRQKT